MTPEQKAVSSWLYGLNRTEYALQNLEKSIDVLEKKLCGGVIQATHYSGVQTSTHSTSFNTEDKALSMMLGDPERLEYLKILREPYQTELDDYTIAIERMIAEEAWGYLGKDIIHAKYRRKITPDQMIYVCVVFCTKETFYRTLRKSLQFIFDVTPARFRK